MGDSLLLFRICYAGLDNFKPINDVFGYNRADDVIQMPLSVSGVEGGDYGKADNHGDQDWWA